MEATKQLNQPTTVNPFKLTPHIEVITQRVDATLAELIDLETCERVVIRLHALGIKATPGCISHCVLAEYLKRFIPELAWVEIDTMRKTIIGAVIVDNSTREIVTTLPSFLVGFADAFDQDEYDVLVGPECNCAAFLAGN